MGLSWDWSRESGVDVLRAVTVIFPNEEPPVAGFFFSRTRCEDGGMTLALIPAAAIVGPLALLPLARPGGFGVETAALTPSSR